MPSALKELKAPHSANQYRVFPAWRDLATLVLPGHPCILWELHHLNSRSKNLTFQKKNTLSSPDAKMVHKAEDS
jgi:hypothetical protein